MRLLALVGVVAGCTRAAGVGDGGDPDADRGTPLHCSAPAPLPAWADATATELAARCGDVAVELAALAGGATRVRYAAADAPPERSWAVATPPAPATAAWIRGTNDGGAELCTAELAVRVDATCRLRATLPDGTVIAEDAGGFATFVDDDGRPAVRLDRRAGADRVYGLGERTGGLDRRGRRLVFWNTDAYDPAIGGWGPGADPLYQSIPFEVRTRGPTAWGVFTDVPFHMAIDLGATDAARDAIVATGGPARVTQYLLPGPAMADVVRRYTELAGRAARPPRWAVGFHQSRWGYPDAGTVEAVAARFADEALPLAAVWLDIQHMDGFRTFTWHPTAFADPDAMIARLAARGVRTVVIADPGIKVDPAWSFYQSGVAGDHFLRDASGAIYEGVVWPGPSAFPDFTRAATRAWWGDAIRATAARGVAGIWLDVNEPTTFPESGGATVPDALAADGDGVATTMAEVHNVYALRQAEATRDALAASGRRPFVLSRAGYAGIQRAAAVWTGDVPSTWTGLADTLPMLLGLGISGVPFVGSDVGGYSGHASAELYARWLAVGAASPFFRAHVTNGVPGQEPWQFGDDVTAIARARLGERARWTPYIEALFAEAAATGAPVLRPLVWEFPGDERVADIGDQAMLGPHVMIAPVVTPGATSRRVVMPAGRWVELPSGAIVDGPTAIDVPAPLPAAPMWAREGAIVPSWPDGRAAGDALALDVVPGPTPTRLVVIDDDGDSIDGAATHTAFELARTATGASLAWTRDGSAPAPPTLVIRVRPVDGAVTRVGDLPAAATPAAAIASGHGWAHDAADRAVVIAVAAGTGGALAIDYDATIADPRPPVAVRFEVAVPADTPPGAPIHVALSSAGWSQQPLAWIGPHRAAGTFVVPRGDWVEYKFTRGSWATVEKTASCDERTNRLRVGAAPPAPADRVATWRDRCGNRGD